MWGQRGVSSCLTAFRRLQSDAFSFRGYTGPSVEAVVTAAEWKGASCAIEAAERHAFARYRLWHRTDRGEAYAGLGSPMPKRELHDSSARL